MSSGNPALVLAALALAGCATTNTDTRDSTFGLGKMGLFIEGSVPRERIRIQRVAVVPNRLPASLLDPEKWRRSNFTLIQREFTKRGFDVVDYDTSARAFEDSGLPVEDTSVSRDKYAEFARNLGVDAIVVPYYGTFSWSSSLLFFSSSEFAVSGSFQIFLANENDFLARIDMSASRGYRVGDGTAAGLGLLAGSMAPSVSQEVRTAAQIGMGLGVAFDLIYGAVQAARAPDAFWKAAFDEAITTGLKPFFEAIGPPDPAAGHGPSRGPPVIRRPNAEPRNEAPIRRAPQPPAPEVPQAAGCTTSAECAAGQICLGGLCR